MKKSKILTGMVITSLLLSNALLAQSAMATSVEVNSSEMSEFKETGSNEIISGMGTIGTEEQTEISEGESSSLVEPEASEMEQETVTSETDPIDTELEIVTDESSEKLTKKKETTEQHELRGASFKSTNPEVQKMIDALTSEDRAKAVGSDGLGEEFKVIPEVKAGFGQYPDVNQYIAEKSFKNPTVTRDSRFGTTPKNEFKFGKPIGIVIHETANPNSTIDGEVNFMFNNWQNAFVHAYASGDRVIETAPTDYLSWGAGPNANPYYIHIELCRSKSFDDFARSVNSDSYWVASKLVEFNLQPSFGDTDGLGSIISHNGIANFWGGTDHTDPIAYFAQWGYTMSEFYDLVVKKYNELKGKEEGSKELATVKESQDLNKNMKIKDGGYYLYNKPYGTKGASRLYPVKFVRNNGDSVHVIKKITTSEGVVEYQLSGDSEVDNYYVDHRALEDFATIQSRKTVNRTMKVVDDIYFVYNKAYNTEGSKRVVRMKDKYPNGSSVKVLEEITTSEGVIEYKLSNDEYVDHRALEDFATIKSSRPVNKTMRVVDDIYFVYNKAYNTEGSKRVVRMKNKYPNGSSVKVLEEITTSEGVIEYKLSNDEYVDHRALEDFATIKSRKPVNRTMKVVEDIYFVYNKAYNTEGSKRVVRMKNKYPNGSSVKVLEEITTSEGVIEYKLSNDEYVDHRAFKEFATIKSSRPVNKTMRVVEDIYFVYNKAYNTEGSKRVVRMKNKYPNGSSVKVLEEITTSEGVVEYKLSNDEYVDHRAFE